MTLQVIGAGVGRTGTHSLKLALETLLGAPCYHMLEVFGHPEHVPLWTDAARGAPVDWDALFDGYVATVDWPGAAFWPELTAAYPDAVVLLSRRDDPDVWWRSAEATIVEAIRRGRAPGAGPDGRGGMVGELLAARFTPEFTDEEQAKAAYVRHLAEVRAAVPGDRLVEWRPSDGWGPLCDSLGVPVPDVAFPHTNTTAEFRAMLETGPPGVSGAASGTTGPAGHTPSS
jgi:hypothetical protein